MNRSQMSMDMADMLPNAEEFENLRLSADWKQKKDLILMEEWNEN